MFRFDETDPRFLTVYTGDEHAKPQDYQNWIDLWRAWLERNQPFGVIMVSEPHEHHEGEEDYRLHEAEINRIINDFRRDYRERTSQINTGFARIFSLDMKHQYWKTEEEWDVSREANNRYAQYSWGVQGDMFVDLASAQTWLSNQTRSQLLPKETIQLSSQSSERVGLFYGSSTGVTAYIAEDIQEAWTQSGMGPIKPINIGDVKDVTSLLNFDCLVLGISTWNIGQLQDDWQIVFPQFDVLDFTGKKVAIFGVGDQLNYPDNFLDAVGILGKKLIERGAELVGFWYDEHYKFRESSAFVEGKFMGLGIDDVNQSKLTSKRVEQWVAQIIGEFESQSQSISSV